MDKEEIIKRFIEKSQRRAKEIEEVLASTRKDIVSAPGAMQSHSDTSRYQLGRLATNTQEALHQTKKLLGFLTNLETKEKHPITQIGSIVRTKENEVFFIVPYTTTDPITTDEGKINMVLDDSPIGKALIGKREGEKVKIITPSKTKILIIASIY